MGREKHCGWAVRLPVLDGWLTPAQRCKQNWQALRFAPPNPPLISDFPQRLRSGQDVFKFAPEFKLTFANESRKEI